MARAGLTRERVVAAAADLADTVGFENITVAALARGFGVKDASLYAHVRNLSDLSTRVAIVSGLDLADRISDALAGRAGRDALLAFAHAYRAFALEHPGRYAATQLDLDPSALDDHPGLRRNLTGPYALLQGYGLAEPALTDAVRLLRSTFHGFVALELAGGFRHHRDVERSWANALEALHIALSHWPEEVDR
ncbi:TetR family transcriptional regulator [Streptomyces sp. SID8379]|uniref:TetR/AcrR family transcriptional regulator n=1 Tax=unclassified Streptomyces TaxID=2593676 RepID=UPI000477AFC7|nr:MULTISPECIES: TetR-like C-terminal domain-containing protein [unclassified Streptomyces]MYW68320.1 TetR family transcriptional regulator [Streptomyces sp. SID8379]